MTVINTQIKLVRSLGAEWRSRHRQNVRAIKLKYVCFLLGLLLCCQKWCNFLPMINDHFNFLRLIVLCSHSNVHMWNTPLTMCFIQHIETVLMWCKEVSYSESKFHQSAVDLQWVRTISTSDRGWSLKFVENVFEIFFDIIVSISSFMSQWNF